jgi:hypothetical protein
MTRSANRQSHCGKKRRRSNGAIAPIAVLDPLAATERTLAEPTF